jgi:arylsulfatase A-like enzyme
MFEPYEKVDPEIGRCIDQDWCDAGQADDQTLKDYKRHFYAMITGVDMAVGKLVDHLKKLGIYDNTLLVFGSDHGDACGDHGRTSKDNSYYEGIMRLPLVFHWPAGLGTQNRRVGSLVEMVDVMPTLLDLASLPIPPAVQGRSYAT